MCSFDMSARLENISAAAKITVCVLLRAATLTRGERKSELQCLAQASRCIMICIIFLLKIMLRKCFSSSVQHSLNILKYYRQKIISFVPSKLLIYCNCCDHLTCVRVCYSSFSVANITVCVSVLTQRWATRAAPLARLQLPEGRKKRPARNVSRALW